MGLLLKRLLLLFWAAWLTVVFLANLCDGAKEAGLLPGDCAFASGNYRFVAATTARYGTPAWLNALLFAGVIGWEGIAAVLFWRAGRRFAGGGKGLGEVHQAFAAGLGLWAALLLADEVCIAYAVEGTHLRLFAAQLVTLLAVALLPEEAQPGRT